LDKLEQEVQMRDVVGYEGLYAVDEHGSVWSYRKNNLLKPLLSSTGYNKVNLWKDEKMKAHLVHRLVSQAFLENYSEDLQVDHIDRNKQNNNISNLRMVTNQKNSFNRTKTKGYYFNKKAEKWHAQIMLNGKNKHLGYFDSESEAHESYLEGKKIFHII
jgi:hypothetical protein